MAESGYVLAGFETLATILNNFANRDTKKRFDNQFTQEQISTFLSKNCHGFLHSFGQNFTGKKTYKNYIEGEAKLYKNCRDTGFFEGCNFIADSGGFQASIGRINRNETKLLSDLYHKFLRERHDAIDLAFTLDLVPGPGCTLFDSFDDIYRMNLDTYTVAKNLPQEVKDKMIYIHHFRTPKLWNIYERILKEEKMFDEFKHFATGGIVANMSSDTAIPCIIYVLPIIPLLLQAKKFNRSFLNFHILGGANYRDILFYELFYKIVKEKHGIELNISYDSSGLFKGLMIGRFLHVMDDENVIRKIDIREKNLPMRFTKSQRVLDAYINFVHKMSDENNFKRIDMSKIYDVESGTFFEEVKVYSMLYMLEMYGKVQSVMKDVADELYPIYISGDYTEFNRKVELVTRNINGGKITRKQKAKTNSIINSLKMLEDLDESYCKYLVQRHLAKDEFSELDHTKRILTV